MQKRLVECFPGTIFFWIFVFENEIFCLYQRRITCKCVTGWVERGSREDKHAKDLTKQGFHHDVEELHETV